MCSLHIQEFAVRFYVRRPTVWFAVFRSLVLSAFLGWQATADFFCGYIVIYSDPPTRHSNINNAISIRKIILSISESSNGPILLAERYSGGPGFEYLMLTTQCNCTEALTTWTWHAPRMQPHRADPPIHLLKMKSILEHVRLQNTTFPDKAAIWT